MLTEVRPKTKLASPAKWPNGLALTTVPTTFAPAGIAVWPSTITSLSRVAVKVCPVWLALEPRSSVIRMVRGVPAATMMGCGGAGCSGCAGAACCGCAALLSAGGGAELFAGADGVAGTPAVFSLDGEDCLLLQAGKARSRQAARIRDATRLVWRGLVAALTAGCNLAFMARNLACR